jgi:hypothetical protein
MTAIKSLASVARPLARAARTTYMPAVTRTIKTDTTIVTDTRNAPVQKAEALKPKPAKHNHEKTASFYTRAIPGPVEVTYYGWRVLAEELLLINFSRNSTPQCKPSSHPL